jgi:hypothetical protein
MAHAGGAVLWKPDKNRPGRTLAPAYPAPGEFVISRWIQRKITSTT